MNDATKKVIEKRLSELQQYIGMKSEDIQYLGCCGRADGSYRCTSK